MVAEPMGFPDFVIRRAKAIANAARMKKDEKVLRDLRAEAEAMGVTVDIPAIDVALDG